MKPIVSVCVQTYNHEKYISKCLDGILMQQTTFPFEIILGEDESNDGTREICMAYAKNHPDIIKLFLRSRKDVIYINGRPTGRYNLLENLKSCRGKYVALCEGDDYWTDPKKLQVQVEFLEANSDFVICCHNAQVIDENENVIQDKKIPHLTTDYDYSSFELQKGAFLLTLSLVFRNINIMKPLKSFNNVLNGDTILISLLGAYGKGRYIDNILPAKYRVHSGGMWSLININKRLKAKRILNEALMKYHKSNSQLYLYFTQRQKTISREVLQNLESASNFLEYLDYNIFYIRHNSLFNSTASVKALLKQNWNYWNNLFK